MPYRRKLLPSCDINFDVFCHENNCKLIPFVCIVIVAKCWKCTNPNGKNIENYHHIKIALTIAIYNNRVYELFLLNSCKFVYSVCIVTVTMSMHTVWLARFPSQTVENKLDLVARAKNFFFLCSWRDGMSVHVPITKLSKLFGCACISHLDIFSNQYDWIWLELTIDKM